MTVSRVAVIGAGAQGASTAVCLQDALAASTGKHHQVEISVLAESLTPHITSTAAAGLIIPHLLADTPMHLVRKWATATMKHLQELNDSPEAREAGVQFISGYILFTKQESQLPDGADMMYGVRELTVAEVHRFPGAVKGYFLTTLLAQPNIYVPWLLNRFVKRGGKIVQRKVNCLNELARDYDVIINCSGIGARQLAEDYSLVPIRGQVIKARAPWMKHFVVIENEDVYIIPTVDSVTLGGVHQEGRWDCEEDKQDTDTIWRRTCELVPSLKRSKIENVYVGLRPSRPTVRVELECRHYGQNTVPVIHNYGHGGSGITLSWGCALDAAQLAKDACLKLTHAKL